MKFVDTLNQYQTEAANTHLPTSVDHSATYFVLGLVGEAGEFANKYKKIFRDHHGDISPEMRLALIYELGDILWYVAGLCTELEVPLAMAASINLDKLATRQDRNTIRGNGDLR